MKVLWIQALAAKLDHLTTLGPHMVKGKNQLLQAVLWLLHMQALVCTPHIKYKYNTKPFLF